MPLTFVVGSAALVFGGGLAPAVDAELRKRFAFPADDGEEYRSEPIEGTGWVQLQHRAAEALGDRKSTRLNSSHSAKSRMPSSA